MWKKKFFKKLNFSSSTFPCFYCNADSDELKYFLILFVGGLSLGAVFLGIGLVLRGAFRQSETMADFPLRRKMEEEQENKKEKEQ